ncbi:MAG: hypothetical protein NC483_01045 [Ruminococcus sp.]|nr:hypothetical protein [Ruminococcus sp.]
MKLLNLNIGIKIDNNKQVIDLISKEKYDIVTIQEVMRGIDKTVFDKYNNSNTIKLKTNYKYNFFGPLWIANHHEKNGIITKDFGGFTEQGNEILSCHPFVKSSNCFYYKNYEEFSDVTNLKKDDHPRAIIDSIININGKELQIICVHGIWNENKTGDDRTINQSKFLLSKVRNDIPCIVAGDFNLLPNTESIQIINEKMINLINKFDIKTTRPTFDDGLDKGDLVCDYIFINNKVKVNDFKVINSNVSDHLPIILDFDI